MPEYFGITTEFEKKPESKTLVKDLYDLLESEGFRFLSGCRESEGYSLERQIAVNQDYINRGEYDFNGSLYQALFQFSDFDEVRCYWNIRSHYENEIEFSMIIPEYNFVEQDDCKTILFVRKMEAVKNAFIRVWEMQSVVAIQTRWENSDIPPTHAEICAGWQPQTEPFSIVSSHMYQPKWKAKVRRISRNGLLLENDENWFFS